MILNERLRTSGRIEKERNENHYLGGVYMASFERYKSSSSHQLFKKEQVDEAKKSFWVGLGPSYTIDKRNHNLYPSKGWFYSFQDITSTNFNGKMITSLSSDYRWFTKLWNDKNLLALQLRATQQIGDVPFYFMNNLGGENRLRGYHENRFIDKFATYFQVEGRKHFYKRWKLAGFVGTGYVSPSIVELGTLHTAIGGGMRYELVKDTKMNLRGDLTLNDEGQFRMYIGLSEAF